MERLDPRLVNGNVKQGAKEVHIGCEGNMKRSRRKTGVSKQLFKLRRPFLPSNNFMRKKITDYTYLHQLINFRHLFRVLNCWRRLGPM